MLLPLQSSLVSDQCLCDVYSSDQGHVGGKTEQGLLLLRSVNPGHRLRDGHSADQGRVGEKTEQRMLH